ncbi:MAG: hypothetical protein IT225_02445 [Flavobacteriales bacterium]|nr:hypothetical protein [Flavobacteriales bacterium]
MCPGDVQNDRQPARRYAAFGSYVDRVDAALDGWYARLGAWPGSVILALLVIVAAFFHIDGGLSPLAHGADYAALSLGPFDPERPNGLRLRILGPLIGWLLHLRGPLFVVVPWIFLVGFLAVVNGWCRRAGCGSTLALAVILALAFSPTCLHSLAAPGFIDPVTYFFVALALMHVRNVAVSCASMALAVCAHESAAFLIPAWLLAAGSRVVWSRLGSQRILLFLLMLLPYFGYRWWMAQLDPTVLTTAFYLSSQNLIACIAVGPLATAFGIFGTFRLHWLVLALCALLVGRKGRSLQWALLLILLVALTLLFAYDTTRMFCWTFPVLGAQELAHRVGRHRAVALFLIAWMLNFLIPPYTTTGAETYKLRTIRNYVTQ